MNYTRIDRPNAIVCDTGKKINFLLSVKVKSAAPHTLRCFYGPFEDYTRFEVKFQTYRVNGFSIYWCERLVSARYLRIEYEGVAAEDVFVNLEPEMRDEPDVARFSSDNEFFNRLYEVSADTLRACIVKHFRGNSYYGALSEEERAYVDQWHGDTTDYVITDAPRRDREVWVGDLLPEIRTVYTMFGDAEVIKNSLDAILEQMDAAGRIPACSVAKQTFYEYNCWLVIVVYEYLLLSGDTAYFDRVAPALRRVLEHVESVLEGDCLRLDTFNTWAYSLKRHNFITSSQCVLYRSFALAAKLFLERDADYCAHCEALANRVKAQINARGYDEEAGWYLDELDLTGDNKRYSLDANALAVLFGVCPAGRTERVFSNMREKLWTRYGTRMQYPREESTAINHTHSDNIWPFGVSFEVEARLACGDYDNALELVRRTWGTMLDNGATTFWEAINMEDGTFYTKRFLPKADDSDTYNSACHGWSAGLPHLVNAYIVGVRPTAFGYSEFTLAPERIELFKRLEVRIPTPHGEIAVRCRRRGQMMSYRLTLPPGVHGVYRGAYALIPPPGAPLAEEGLASGEYLLRLPAALPVRRPAPPVAVSSVAAASPRPSSARSVASRSHSGELRGGRR